MMRLKIKLLTEVTLNLLSLVEKHYDNLPPEFTDEVARLAKDFRIKMIECLIGNKESDN